MPYTSEEAKQRRAMLKANHCCTICTTPLGEDTHVKCKTCRDKHDKGYTDYRHRTKVQTFEAYGGAKCACCGETELLLLTLDHINENGAAERKEANNKGGKQFYQWLKNKDYPLGYQVLCFSCNAGRHLNGGVCPHQTTRLRLLGLVA